MNRNNDMTEDCLPGVPETPCYWDCKLLDSDDRKGPETKSLTESTSKLKRKYHDYYRNSQEL